MINRKKSSFWNNIYVVLCLRLSLVFVLYTITRFLFYVLNQSLFADMNVGYLATLLYRGLKFDASAIAYTNSLVILLHILPFKFRFNRGYQKAVSLIFYIVNTIGLTLNMIDVVYYRFTLRRTTTAVFQEFENENATSFLSFIFSYWYVSLIVLSLVFLLIGINKKIKVHNPSVFKGNYAYSSFGILLLAIVAFFTVGAMRGGYTSGVRPINLNSAVEHVLKPEHSSIVLNTPFSLIRTIGKSGLPRIDYFDFQELNELFNVEHIIKNDTTPFFNKFAGRNVMIIIMESLHKEWVGVLNKDIKGYTGYTPCFDSLSTQGYLFARGYANGRKSIEASPAIFASIPSSETPFVLSTYSGNKINSLASVLKSRGYTSAFYHGAVNGSMRFDSFVKQAGFDHYFGMTEYNNPDDFDGHWGIPDEPYLQYTAKELSKLPQPFISSVFTLTSHYPFKIPKEYDNHFPEGNMPIHECLGYSDYALRRFFETASQQDWFYNTLFVITADHAVDGHLAEYKTAEGAFTIPILFYAPGSDLVGFDNTTIVQQTDIMPTVLSMLGVKSDFVAFGSNMFSKDSPHFAYNYYNGAYQLIEGKWLMQYMNETVTGFYNVVEDRLMKRNLVGKHLVSQAPMEQRIKALIQQYNNRLIDNKLTVQHDKRDEASSIYLSRIESTIN
jgi:phosphoglycerol transferase MdoB-like AlkP superfamily enzyme